MRQRGASLVEAVLAFFLIAVALVALYGTFSGSYRHSVMTRNQIAATFLANSFFEEVEAHSFGSGQPPSWPVPKVGASGLDKPGPGWQQAGYPSTQTLPIYVEGRVQASNYHRQVWLQNGSFVGKGSGENWDEVTVIITWEEMATQAHPGGLKTLTARRLVWRENAAH